MLQNWLYTCILSFPVSHGEIPLIPGAAGSAQSAPSPTERLGRGGVGGGEGSFLLLHSFCKGGNNNDFYCSLATDTFSQEALAGSSPWEGTRWHQSQRIRDLRSHSPLHPQNGENGERALKNRQKGFWM